MTITSSVHREPRGDAAEKCVHCFGGWVFEPTEDPLEDEAHACHMGLGTGSKMGRAKRKAGAR